MTDGRTRTGIRLAVIVGLCALPMMIAAAEPSRSIIPANHSQVCPSGDGYWVISSRSHDGGLEQSQRGQHEVFACDADGRRCGSNIETLLQSLRPGVPVCIVIHGSFVDWKAVWQESRETNAWLRSPCPDRPLNVVFFTWPSDDTPKLFVPIDITILGRRASRHSFYIAELISLISDDHPICLIGHSHGARMVVSTLHVLGGGKIGDVSFSGGPYHQHRIRAVLAAGAFDHHWLNPGERYEAALPRAEFVLNLQNRRDLALGTYPFHRPLATQAAGRVGLSSTDRRRLGPQSQKIEDVDITRLIGPGHIWPHYYAQPQLALLIAPQVFCLDP